MTVRPATALDLPACAAIVNGWIDATDWLPRIHPAAEIAALFGPELLHSRRLLVAEREGAVAGYLSATAAGFIGALYLAPAARGQGLGRALLDAAKALSPGGLSLDVWAPNTGAQRFYRREGFREDPTGREEDTAEGVPTLRMVWRGG